MPTATASSSTGSLRSRGNAAFRARVALAWVLAKPVVTAPIIGVTKDAHLADALAAVDLTLTAEEIAQLEEPYTPRAVSGF
jgi:aryl-alcohol dehydrogenase (NADP+)